MFTEFGQVIGTLRVHVARAGGAQPAGRRHSQRHLLAGRIAVRTAHRQTPLRCASGCAATALDEMLRIIREEEPPKPSTRLSNREQLPSIAANRGIEPKKLTGTPVAANWIGS